MNIFLGEVITPTITSTIEMVTQFIIFGFSMFGKGITFVMENPILLLFMGASIASSIIYKVKSAI